MSQDKPVSNQFIGREDLIASLWTELDRRSFLLSGPRRIGKTALLKQLAAAPARGWRAVRVDVEGLKTPTQAVSEIEKRLTRAGLLTGNLGESLERVEEISVAGSGVKLRGPDRAGSPWQALELLLERTIRNLPPGERLLLALDEVPWWLDEIQRAEGPQGARLALASLRRIRQDEHFEHRLRMLLTGSIGLAGLARSLGASAELNDLQPELEVPPLPTEAGAALFEAEIAIRGGTCAAETAAEAHHRAGGSPHWIKSIAVKAAAHLTTGQPRLTQALLARSIDDLLHPRMRDLFSDEGSSHLIRRHGAARARRMVSILDAASDGPVHEDILASAAMVGVSPPDRREIRELIYILVDEYYLQEDPGRPAPHYRFVSPLFCEWWRRYGGAP